MPECEQLKNERKRSKYEKHTLCRITPLNELEKAKRKNRVSSRIKIHFRDSIVLYLLDKNKINKK